MPSNHNAFVPDDPTTIFRPTELLAIKNLMAQAVTLTDEHRAVLRCELAVIKSHRGIPEHVVIVREIAELMDISAIDIEAYLSECSIAMALRELGE